MSALVGAPWAVELAGFAKSYPVGWTGRRVVAVQPFSLRVARGRVLGLLGPNGSGKSTVLRALAGLIAPSAGQVQIMGAVAGSDEARARVGYLPESARFAAHQTGREFLHYCGGLSGLTGDKAVQRVEAVLTWSSLGPAADRKIATYSKGMQQRLGLAQAILHEPAVVLLDEPASGLDPEGRLALVRLLRDMAGQGRTVVFSSHLLAQAGEVCDHVVILGQGRLLAEGSPAVLLGPARRLATEPTALEKLYLEKVRG